MDREKKKSKNYQEKAQLFDKMKEFGKLVYEHYKIKIEFVKYIEKKGWSPELLKQYNDS